VKIKATLEFSEGGECSQAGGRLFHHTAPKEIKVTRLDAIRFSFEHSQFGDIKTNQRWAQ
jgi:hypothetical protein